MGAIFALFQKEENCEAGVKRQAEGLSNPMYQLANLGGGGLLYELSKKAMLTKNYKELDDTIRQRIPPYTYNNGEGKMIHCAHLACLRNRDRGPSKQFPEIKAVPEDQIFDYKFDGSPIVAKLTEGHSPETHPQYYTKHCWDVECRGAVGETVFHVCFLCGTAIHLHLAKRMLKFFPNLLNDIYLSEEYYGENVLHMAVVAEDPSLVKWLLEVGSDFDRKCYGNFFTCDDQKKFRMDSIVQEEVFLPLVTNYQGYVAWGEYAHNFAAVLNQEECYRLILAKGGNHDLQDINGCTVAHILVVFDNMKMFDMAVECGAAINIENKAGLTPLTMAAYLARMDMFFHIASIEREVYWQIGNVTCSAYPLKYLDTIHSETGQLQMNSALNLIVFGPKLEHLDLIEYVIVDLLNVKYKTYIRKIFMRQFFVFSLFLGMSMFVFTTRPSHMDAVIDCAEMNNTFNGSMGFDLMNFMETNNDEQTTTITSTTTAVLTTTTDMPEEEKVCKDHCYLNRYETDFKKVRLTTEILLIFGSIAYLLGALREYSFLGKKTFKETLAMCPGRVCFLIACVIVLLMIPARLACFAVAEDIMSIFVMGFTGCYTLFFCRGFKLVGPMVVMIYRMLAQDLAKFGIVFSIFIMGFSQGLYIAFQSFKFTTDDEDITRALNRTGECPDDAPDGDCLSNPMPEPVESVIHAFMMSLGDLEPTWDTIEHTDHNLIGTIHWALFVMVVFLLLLNLLIAMMGETYAKIAEIKNEWMRQWAKTVLITERLISPAQRLKWQNIYCDINSDGEKALVMKQFLAKDKIEEIEEIIEMKITHRKNIDRIQKRFGRESVSKMGLNMAGASVIIPDSSDGTEPENPYGD